MKRMSTWLAPAIAMLCLGSVPASAKDQANIVRDYTDIVAPADQQAYEAGIKSYSQCLAQHGYKYAWTSWVHETGNVYSYSYVTDPMTWASFDAMHDAGKPCDATFRTQVNPHLKGETSVFMRGDPEFSHLQADTLGTPALIEVTYFKLKPGQHQAFKDVARKIRDAAQKTKWPSYFLLNEVIDGGEGAPDFVLVSPAKSWADLGKEADPTLWKMLENAYGKADADALRKTLRDAIQESPAHVDSYNAELSYRVAGK